MRQMRRCGGKSRPLEFASLAVSNEADGLDSAALSEGSRDAVLGGLEAQIAHEESARGTSSSGSKGRAGLVDIDVHSAAAKLLLRELESLHQL